MKNFCLLILLSSSLYVSAQPGNTEALRKKAITLRRFLEQNHYQPLQWNDSASERLYTKWMDELDDEKLFFTQADMAILNPYKTKLDEEMMGKGWEFFNRSTALYRSGVMKADSIIEIWLAKPLDFSKPDNMVWPCSNYAANPGELSQRWQKFLKWRVLESIASALTDEGKPVTEQSPADFAKLEKEVREKVRKREKTYIRNILKTAPLFAADMEDDYLNAIAWCYDPHTNYMNTKEKKEFDTEMSASEYSAGLDLEENEKGEKAISFLQPGGSAWRSGQLHTGDLLLSVKSEGVEKKVEDIEDDAELDKMLGSNSQAEVEVTVRTTAGEVKTVKLNKEKVTDEEGIVKSYVLHGSKNVGYINLPGFYSREDETITDEREIKYDGCANDVSKEIVKLRKDTISGLILDLRYNGGGSMWEAMQLAGIFIDIGPVASVKDKDGKLHFLKDPNRGTIYDGPLMVLINGASASASEFVSAVLQDYNRAIIVGGTTYGKGTAQIVMPMDTLAPSKSKTYDDYVKVTEQKFYRVNGSTTQWKGVIPDIDLPDLYADESYKEKANSSALQPDNVRAGIYQPSPVIPVQSLKTKSEQRISNDPYFNSITDFGKWLKEYKNGRTIPLQWNSYAVHYRKTMEMFKQFSKEDGPTGHSTITVTNNGFDLQRINLSAAHSKEINKTYVEHVQEDRVLNEAYNIMMDWIGK
jgi:carboxyl-terminal processing protease